MKKLGIFILTLLVISGGVFAFGYGRQADGNEDIISAIESGDYDAWVKAMSGSINKENFDRITQMHQERETARFGQFRQGGFGGPDMREIIESGDYDAWAQAVDEMPGEKPFEINQETFDLIVQMHEAKISGDIKAAQDLREELGLPEKRGMGKSRQGCRGFA